ncbi:tRNA-uridine aminocarboxypropyltransferase [Klebsiella michiganensis]|uniref:tRNA-uridine aminocarboxypropyltransferase n=1 Tax=Klebsiella michiganensis TaxID=1134687 RepID=UPI0009079ADF|nr:DTW domain-containing protein [Klebsiella michiganensis]
MKPSNTGRLIADILPDTEAFQWSRTEPPQALLDLVADAQYQPIVVFPASYAGPERQVLDSPLPGKTTAVYHARRHLAEARKMFRKSPWLDALPMISVDLSRISAYHLREAHAEGQYCTAEVAIALLDLAEIKAQPRPLASTSAYSERATWQEKLSIRVVSQHN